MKRILAKNYRFFYGECRGTKKKSFQNTKIKTITSMI